jgi:hypothetical protein
MLIHQLWRFYQPRFQWKLILDTMFVPYLLLGWVRVITAIQWKWMLGLSHEAMREQLHRCTPVESTTSLLLPLGTGGDVTHSVGIALMRALSVRSAQDGWVSVASKIASPCLPVSLPSGILAREGGGTSSEGALASLSREIIGASRSMPTGVLHYWYVTWR